MTDLARLTIDAHGGLDRWQQLVSGSARLRNTGVLWSMKHPGVDFSDVTVRVALHREWASHTPFLEPGWRTSFDPTRVAIERADGSLVDERFDPRASFAGHALESPWDRLQLAYFAGYAMWTYLTTPFLFAAPGVETVEAEPWRENGETWRRLVVRFPPGMATHSTTQTFHIGPDGLLRRHDYDADVLGGSSVAHYVHDYINASGVLVPTRRRVYPRRPDSTSIPDPLIVGIDLSDVAFT